MFWKIKTKLFTYFFKDKLLIIFYQFHSNANHTKMSRKLKKNDKTMTFTFNVKK